MAIDEQQFGRLIGHIEAISPSITEIKCDVKKILEAQAVTEERLKNGNVRFEKYDKRFDCSDDKFEDVDGRLRSVWACLRKKADWRVVYSLVVAGFVALGFLLDYFYSR